MVITNSLNYQKKEKLVLAIGVFDGVHLGHAFLISHLKEVAQKNSYKVGLITFPTHPKAIFSKQEFKQLNTNKEKHALLETYGVDYLFVEEFSEEFRNRTAEEFIKDILIDKLNMHILVMGHDHTFGKNKSGTFDKVVELSKKYDFTVEQAPVFSKENNTINSSLIRDSISEGEIQEANQMLGYDYSLEGIVIEGDKIGRTIGFPTANIQIPSSKILPQNGVYIVAVEYNNKNYFGIMNIGNRPTVNGKRLQVEVHILDFDKEIYEETIHVLFKKRIRDEKKFNSLDELVAQINLDKDYTLRYIKTIEK